MRLTLRTLLAYLDDVLDPAETKEIGQKIQESPVAASLVSRVKEVIRKRRLAAPDVRGKGQGIDANVIAQYLDNTLPADRVADVERICLDSDVHLAEVAACHEILSLVLGEPSAPPQAQLERLYALGPVSDDARLQAPAESAERAPVRAAAMNGPKPELMPARDFHEGLPDYLKPTPWTQRFAPVAGLAAVIIAAVLALAFDPTLTQTLMGFRPAPGDGADPAAAPQDAPRRPAAPAAPGRGVEPPAQVAAVVPGEMPRLPDGIDPPAPADAPDATPTAPQPGATQPGTTQPGATLPAAPLPAAPMPTAPSVPVPATVPAATVPAATVPAATVPAVTAPGAAPMPPQPAMPVEEPPERILVPMQYVSTDGILLRYQRSDQHWYVHEREAELHPEDIYACPEPFEAVLKLDDGQLQATLLGDTVVQILPANERYRIRLNLRRGRLILTRPAEAEDLNIELSASGRHWELSLPTVATVLSVERTIRTPTGQPFPPTPDWSRLALAVAEGSVVVTRPMAEPLELTAGQAEWLSLPPDDVAIVSAAVPGWIDPQRRTQSTTLRRYSMLFEREFDATAAVDLSIPAIVRDPRPKISELSTRVLGTTESYAELARALVRSEHAESRAAAAEGLRAWLIQDGTRVAQLQEVLRGMYPGEESAPLVRLLEGFSTKDAQDRLTSIRLVELLRSNYVEVRELAIDQLERLTGRRLEYRPLSSASAREQAINRWMGHIEKEGALVKPVVE